MAISKDRESIFLISVDARIATEARSRRAGSGWPKKRWSVGVAALAHSLTQPSSLIVNGDCFTDTERLINSQTIRPTEVPSWP